MILLGCPTNAYFSLCWSYYLAKSKPEPVELNPISHEIKLDLEELTRLIEGYFPILKM